MSSAAGFFKFQKSGLISSSSLNSEMLEQVYGIGAFECLENNKKSGLVLSRSRPFDLIDLEQLLASVGWSRRPLRRVRRALDNSLLKVGLWRHDPKFPRLVGFARCTGDGVLEATVWDVAVHPLYQGNGLGKELMIYILELLKEMEIKRVTLFADPGVVDFYLGQGWELEPQGNRCCFWYAN